MTRNFSAAYRGKAAALSGVGWSPGVCVGYAMEPGPGHCAVLLLSHEG